MTEAAFAESIYVKPTALSAWITGSRKPSASSLLKLAANLNTTVDYLTGRTNRINDENPWKEIQISKEEEETLWKEVELLRLIDNCITLLGYDPDSTNIETLSSLEENIKQYISDQCEQVLKKSARPVSMKHVSRRRQKNKEKEGK